MFNRNLISISVASVLLTSSFAVSANTQKEEEKDSVTSWGKWAQQYATAAGGEINTNALSFSSLGQGETGRNGQNEPGFDQKNGLECAPGSNCGYASIYRISASENDGVNTRRPSSAKFNFALLGSGEEEVEGALFRVVPIDGSGLVVSPLLTDSVAVADLVEGINDEFGIPLGFEGEGGVYYKITDGSLNAITNANFECTSRHQCSGSLSELAEGGIQIDGSEGSVIHGLWLNAGEDVTGIFANVGGFVYGQTSTLDDIESLKSNLGMMMPFANVMDLQGDGFGGALLASYQGHTALGAPVHLSINFTDNTWGGSFNGGSDSLVLAYQSENGNSALGHVGFTVTNASINGVNLTAGSEHLSASDALGAVTGSVNASFFGEGASNIAGVAEIVKTTESYENAQHVSTFDAELEPMKYAY